MIQLYSRRQAIILGLAASILPHTAFVENTRAYEGLVTSSTPIGTGFMTTKIFTSRSRHIFSDNVSSVRFVFSNWIKSKENFLKQSSGVDAKIKGWVSLQSKYYPITFEGRDEGSIPDGGDLISDRIFIAASAGEEFYVNTIRKSEKGLCVSGNKDSTHGEKGSGDFKINDAQAREGSFYNIDEFSIFRPTAVLGKTSKRSFLLIGDSKSVGLSLKTPVYEDTSSVSPSLIMPSLAPRYAVVNASMTGMRLELIKNYASSIFPLSKYSTDVIVQLGTNDFQAGMSDEIMRENYKGFLEIFPNKKIWLTTIDPRRDFGGIEFNSVRIANNEWKRSRPTGFFGYIEIADVFENRNSGKFRYDTDYNSDKVHQTLQGYDKVVKSGVVLRTLGLA